MPKDHITLKVRRLTPDAQLPTRAHPTDAGLDLVATTRKTDTDGCVTYGTGLAVEIPPGYVGLLFPRSSIYQRDLTLTNSVGVMDSGYRGEIFLKFKPMLNFARHKPRFYEVGERIGQLVVVPIPIVSVMEVPTLSDSERGTGAYGSSGQR